MPYMNQPQDLHRIYTDLDSRLRKLETAVRFTAPPVDFSTNMPTNPRQGDIFYDTHTQRLVYWNGTAWFKISQASY